MKTKLFLLTLLGCCSLLAAPTTYGYTFIGQDTLNLTYPINDDLYTVGNKIDFMSSILGDALAVGNEITIASSVQQDIQAAGNTILLIGSVGDDARLAWNSIKIHWNVWGDLVVLGQNIEIAHGITIEWDATISSQRTDFQGDVNGILRIDAEEVTLNGTFKSNAIINAKRIIIGPDAHFLGNVTYESTVPVDGFKQVTKGHIQYVETDKPQTASTAIKAFISYHIVFWTLVLSILGGLFVFLMPQTTQTIAWILSKNKGKSFFFGLVTFAVIPFAVALLMVSFIGIPLGLLLGSIYWFMIVFYELPLVILATARVRTIFFQDKNRISVLGTLFTLIAFSGLFSFIIWIDIILAFFAWGALILYRLQAYGYVKIR